MSDSFQDAIYGENTFAAFLEQVDAKPDPEAGSQSEPEATEAPPVAGEVPPAEAAGTPSSSQANDGAPTEAETTPPAGAGTGGGATPAAYVPDAEWERTFTENLGKASVAIADKVRETARVQKLGEMRDEFGAYFQATEMPARNLIGKEVPSLDPDRDTETIRDLADAQDYQAAVRDTLVKELQQRVVNQVDENREYLEVVGQSIDVLQSHPDLLRDKVLADRVSQLIKPYEYRHEGKLVGWSVNVLPLISQVKEQLKAERQRTSKPAASAAPAKSAANKPPADPPQAGIKSSAGQSGESDSFDQLWSTLGIAPGTINI